MEELKKGYKKTKIGVIPEDWEVKRLGEVFKIVTGGTPLRDKQEYWQNVSIPWVKTMDLNNSFITQTDEMISEKGLKNSSCKLLPKNTLLIAMYGGFNQIGRTGILKIEATTNQAISALIKKTPLDESFVNYILIFFRDKWKKFAISSRKDPNITKKDIENFIIPLPPLKEQEKIAKILSTWDRAIEIQEELIKEKEKLKTTLMQKLLSGKIRFKEFSEEWEKMEFEFIFDRVPSKKYQIKSNEYLDRGKYPVIDQGSQKIIAYSNNSEKVIKNNSMIIFGDHTRVIKYIDFDFIVGADGTQLLKTKQNFDDKFFYYQLLNKKIPNTGYNRHFKFIKDMLFRVPTLAEQQKIAKVLSTADKEIELLKEELKELKKQKKALMQKLLTGKVRVRV